MNDAGYFAQLVADAITALDKSAKNAFHDLSLWPVVATPNVDSNNEVKKITTTHDKSGAPEFTLDGGFIVPSIGDHISVCWHHDNEFNPGTKSSIEKNWKYIIIQVNDEYECLDM